MRILLILLTVTFSACQLPPKKPTQAAGVKDLSMDKRINPQNLENSIIETVPLMNNAVKSLYSQAKNLYQQQKFQQAIISLERAYEIQPKTPEISQLLAEIYLQEGNSKQAYYWADIATKNGPARGKICEKSWRILAIAAEQLEYNANQARAQEKQNQCLLKAPIRY